MTTRQCFTCTACCEGWLNAKIRGVRLRPYKACKFCTSKGCGIYKKRPDRPCKSFKCGWLKEPSSLPVHMKPNVCGAIILFDRKWAGMPVTFAIPVGERIPDDTLAWLTAYSREKQIPLIWSENLLENGKFIKTKRTGYGPPGFIMSVRNARKNKGVSML
jgi:hypothetical protein